MFQDAGACKTANSNVMCVNPAPIVALGSAVIGTATAKMGDFKMPANIASQVTKPKTLTPSCTGGNVCGTTIVTGSKYFYTPETRVRTAFTLSNMTDATVLAKQKAPDTFETWHGTYDPDYGIYLVTSGKKTADEMFAAQEASNDAMTWILRVVSLVLVIMGLQMVTAPLTVVADVIPVIGPMISGMVRGFLTIFNTLVGCCCRLLVASMCWLIYRPMVGIPLFLAAVGTCACAGFVLYSHSYKKAGPDNDGMYTEVLEEEKP